VPLIKSPGNFVLEELTSDHIQPVRYKKARPPRRNKAIFISDVKFSECLRNPNDILQSVSIQSLDSIYTGELYYREIWFTELRPKSYLIMTVLH